MISKAEYENEEGLRPLDKDENNCLYMSWPMYQRFDGLYYGVPIIAIRFDKIIGQDVGTIEGRSYSRTKVSIVLKLKSGDKQTSSDIKEALSHHHSYDSSNNRFMFHVSVLDPNVFEICLNRKCHANISNWKGGPNFKQQKAQRE